MHNFQRNIERKSTRVETEKQEWAAMVCGEMSEVLKHSAAVSTKWVKQQQQKKNHQQIIVHGCREMSAWHHSGQENVAASQRVSENSEMLLAIIRWAKYSSSVSDSS